MSYFLALFLLIYSQAALGTFDPSVSFSFEDSGSLKVVIETEHLLAKSIQEDDIEDIKSLFANEVVMAKFGDGNPRLPDETEERMKNSWIHRWNQGDPKGGLVVSTKDTNEFVGIIVAGESDSPGEAEIAYIIDEPFQGKGFGTEIVSALVGVYVPWIKARFKKCFKGESLTTIFASASPDNKPSWKILDKLGFTAYDAMRASEDSSESSFCDGEQLRRFNCVDDNGIKRTAIHHPRYDITKWLFRLDV